MSLSGLGLTTSNQTASCHQAAALHLGQGRELGGGKRAKTGNYNSMVLHSTLLFAKLGAVEREEALEPGRAGLSFWHCH